MKARLLAIAAVVSCGCASSAFMRELPHPPRLSATADQATIVFLRPGSTAPNTLVTVFDDTTGFLGDSLPSGCFIARVPPGRHVFAGAGVNTAALVAEVEAGRVYYVEVVLRLGSISSRAHLFAVHPGKERDARLQEQWRACDHYEVDTAAGRKSWRAREAEQLDRVRRAREQVVRFTSEELSLRSLRPQDGRVP